MDFEQSEDERLSHAEHWLDLNRERDFATVSQEFYDLYEASDQGITFREWFRNYFNQNFSLTGEREIKPADIDSLGLTNFGSKFVDEIAGVEIRRPILFFYQKKQYLRFLKKIYGNDQHNSAAMCLKWHRANSDALDRTGVLLASLDHDQARSDRNIAHEVTHSIDPHLYERQGYDDLISEAFAFFADNIDQPETYALLLSRYHERFSRDIPEDKKLTKTEYNALVERLVNTLVEDVSMFGKINAARNLVQSQTVDDFFRCANV